MSCRSSQKTEENFNTSLTPIEEIFQRQKETQNMDSVEKQVTFGKEETNVLKENIELSKNQAVSEEIEEDIIQVNQKEEKEKLEHESGSWHKQSTEITLTDEIVEYSNAENKERISKNSTKDKRNDSLLTNTSVNSAKLENELINNNSVQVKIFQ